MGHDADDAGSGANRGINGSGGTGVTTGSTSYSFGGGAVSGTPGGAYSNFLKDKLGFEYNYSNPFGSFRVQVKTGVQTRIEDVDPVVFIGGAGDATFRNVRSVYEQFVRLNPNLIARYFSWTQEQAIVNYLASVGSAPITLIGHSFGATTAIEIAADASTTINRTINLLITVDPVGRFVSTRDLVNAAANTDRWVNITSNPLSRDRTDEVAFIGNKIGDRVSDYADVSYWATGMHHGEFYGMLTKACPGFMQGGGC